MVFFFCPESSLPHAAGSLEGPWGLSSDRQKKVSVVEVLSLQLRQKLLRSTLELFPLLYFSPSPLWPLGKSADSVWEPSVMGGGCKQEGKCGDWGQSRQKDCGLRPRGILCSD